MIKQINLKEGEQIDLKELFNLKNKNIERIIVTLQDDEYQEGEVKIILIGEEEISKTIDKEYAFFFGGYDTSNMSVECFITALKDSSLSVSIELKNNKGEI